MDLSFFIFELIVLVFSVMVHEVAHGFMAEKLGDPTARDAGRLTFNPIKHIDLFGSVLLPLLLYFSGSQILLGWAKPVPYNPYNLRDRKYGPLKVALIGPVANLILFLVFGLLARLGAGAFSPYLVVLFGFIALMNVNLAVFNLIPIPPLDGSKILTLILPPRYAMMVERIGMSGILFIFLFLYLFAWIIPLVSLNVFYWVSGSGVLQIMNRFLGG
ncbi:MAG: site-2 protease family protein [Patescibacteria group bacterium]